MKRNDVKTAMETVWKLGRTIADLAVIVLCGSTEIKKDDLRILVSSSRWLSNSIVVSFAWSFKKLRNINVEITVHSASILTYLSTRHDCCRKEKEANSKTIRNIRVGWSVSLPELFLKVITTTVVIYFHSATICIGGSWLST